MDKKYVMFVEVECEYRFYYLDGTDEFETSLKDIDIDRCTTEYTHFDNSNPKSMLLYFNHIINEWCLPSNDDCVIIPFKYYIMNNTMDFIIESLNNIKGKDKADTSKVDEAFSVAQNMLDSVSPIKRTDNLLDIIYDEYEMK